MTSKHPTADIIPFPVPRPWSKYTYDARSRANAERIYEFCLGLREDLGPAVGDDPQATPVEAAEQDTVELLQRCREGAARLRGDPPPAS